MPEPWMPGVPRVEPTNQAPIGLAQQGAGLALFTWHTFEADYTYSPDGIAAARYLNSQRSTSHFVFHPTTGALVQLLPANVGARTLRANAPAQHTNGFGSVHMQVEVIARAARPFTADLTAAGKASLARLLDFLRSWGIPDQWAVTSPPPAYPGGSVRRGAPYRSGHLGHAHWWANDHGDPGAIAAPWTITGGTVSTRRPTHADMLAVEAELRRRGLSIYCGPTDWKAGRCRPGAHGHDPDSRHFRGLAVDFGYGAAPVNDLEALIVELIMGTYLARWFPHLRFRKLWNVGPGNHEDHGHLDDNADAWASVVRPRRGVLARDGVDLFVPVSVIPEHVPPLNNGLTLAHVAAAQTALAALGYGVGAPDGYRGTRTQTATRALQTLLGLTVDGSPGPATLTEAQRIVTLQAGFTLAHVRQVQTDLGTLGYYDGDLDGLRGPATQAAIRAFQVAHGLVVDALPGDVTTRTIATALTTPKPEPEPEPDPTPVEPPAPTLAQRIAPHRVGGADRWQSAANAARHVLPEHGEGIILAADGTPDLMAAFQLAQTGTALALPVKRGATGLPTAIRDYITETRPDWIVIVGGPASVTDTAAYQALEAAGITI